MRTGPLQLFMTADAVGGVWTYALDLAGALAAYDVATTLAVLGPAPAEDQIRAASEVKGLTLLETGLPLDWTAASADDLRAAADAMIGLAGDFQADVVHLNSPALAAFGAFDRPLVVACHSDLATWWAAVKTGLLPADFAWRSELVAKGYRAADILVAPTAAFAAETARVYGLPEPPRPVHNGRSPAPPLAPQVSTPGEPYVFTAGRLWDEGKNIATLDKVAARLKLPVYAAGPLEGPAGNTIEVTHLKSLGRVSADAVQAWMGGAAVFVSAPLYEPFGLSVLEAAEAGRPLVLSDLPTLRELWDGAALFAPATDEAAIAIAIRNLLSDPALRTTMSAAAKARASRYTAQAMAAGTMSIYEEALQRSGATA